MNPMEFPQGLEFSDHGRHLFAYNYTPEKLTPEQIADLKSEFYEKCDEIHTPFKAVMKAFDFENSQGTTFSFFCLTVEGIPTPFLLQASAKSFHELVQAFIFYVTGVLDIVKRDAEEEFGQYGISKIDNLPVQFDFDNLTREINESKKDQRPRND